MAVPTERLPVFWIGEQVRALCGGDDVIELLRFRRFAFSEAFGTKPIHRIGIKPCLTSAAIRPAAAESPCLRLFSRAGFRCDGHRLPPIVSTADGSHASQRVSLSPSALDLLMSCELIVALALSIGLLFAACRATVQKFESALRLPDGSAGIDESVTRPMLSLARTCSVLCDRVYERQENLPTRLSLDGWQFDGLHTSNDLSAVCAIVACESAAIVVWRGTNALNRHQVRANAHAELIQFAAMIPDDTNLPCLVRSTIPGRVHAGVSKLYREAAWTLIPAIMRHLQAGRKVYVAGHSQGGALAALTVAVMRAIARLQNNSDLMAAGLITFGSMRPGDARFCEFVRDAIAYDPDHGDFGIQRFRNNNDIVPLLPLISCGYRHAGRELYIWPSGMITCNPPLLPKILQHFSPLARGVIGDGLADHSMTEYLRHLQAVRIPEP